MHSFASFLTLGYTLIRPAKIKPSVFLVFAFFVFSAISEAVPNAIILNPILKNPEQLNVYQNAYVKISNSFSSVLYNITVSESLSQKRVLSIRDFQSGQSFSMSFSKSENIKSVIPVKKM